MQPHELFQQDFGMRLRNLRHTKGYSLEELVDHLPGLSSSQLSKIERGFHSPRLNTAFNLVRAQGEDAFEFLRSGSYRTPPATLKRAKYAVLSNHVETRSMKDHEVLNKPLRNHIANSVRTARKKAGLSQRELAAEAKLSHSTIHRIERGHAEMRLGDLPFVAIALHMQLNDLLPPLSFPKAKAA